MMSFQYQLLAAATKAVSKVVEATPPAVVKTVEAPSAPVTAKVSTASAAFSDFITSLPFYLLNLFFFTYLLLIWLLMVVWVGRDCERRGLSGQTRRNFQALVLVFNFPGLLLYLLQRPALTLEEIKRAKIEDEVLTLELEKLRRETDTKSS